MRKRWLIAAGILLVVVGPVIVTQLLPGEGRRLTGVPLQDLDYTEVRFRNAHQDLDLAGMLFVPEADGAVPAVVIIHGSGTSSRNNGWYSTITSDFLDRGIAVLLPDKRGSEKSSGDWRTSSFEDLATDTLAAVEYLVSRDDLSFSRIGLLGMSQGGWIAPIVASRSSEIDFIVSFSGTTVTPREQLEFEEVHNLRQLGFLPGIANGIAFLSTRYIRNMGQREFWERVEDYDPLPYWESLAVDGLLLFGEADTNVPTAKSVSLIGELDNPRLVVKVFEGSGHAIEDPEIKGTRVIRKDASAAVADLALGRR